MNRILMFDTTIWIDFLNFRSNEKSDLLEKYVNKDLPLVITPTILQEVLQGIQKDKEFEETKGLLSPFPVLQLPHIYAALGAASIYRNIRKKGITIRKSNDCLIAFYAIHFDVPIVHNDRDFTRIAEHTPLKIFTP